MIKNITFISIAKYSLLALVALVGLSLFKGAFKKLLETLGFKQTDEEKDLNNIKSIADKLNAAGFDGDRIASDAKVIKNALGFTYSWYNPFNWTEDEEAAYDILKKYDVANYKALVVAYTKVANRDLTSDLRMYLDGYVDKVEHLWE